MNKIITWFFLMLFFPLVSMGQYYGGAIKPHGHRTAGDGGVIANLQITGTMTVVGLMNKSGEIFMTDISGDHRVVSFGNFPLMPFNTIIGSDAGINMTAAGSAMNVFLGTMSGMSCGNTGFPCSNNIFLGTNAGISVSSGVGNILIGTAGQPEMYSQLSIADLWMADLALSTSAFRGGVTFETPGSTVAVIGFLDIGISTVANVCAPYNPCNAVCPVDTTILSGGCNAQVTPGAYGMIPVAIAENYAISSTTWHCQAYADPTATMTVNTAYAFCGRLIQP